MEHLEHLQKGTNGSAISKHHLEKHPLEDSNYDCRVLKTYSQTLIRYIGEALTLDRARTTSGVMNGRAEWGKLRLPRLGIALTGEEGED